MDSTDVLNRLEGLVGILERSIICTMDVIGLYPHIPHEDGLRNVREIVEECSGIPDICEDFDLTVDDVINLAWVILENNYFEFNGKIYRQKLGTAIGMKFAQAFANLFV